MIYIIFSRTVSTWLFPSSLLFALSFLTFCVMLLFTVRNGEMLTYIYVLYFCLNFEITLHLLIYLVANQKWERDELKVRQH